MSEIHNAIEVILNEYSSDEKFDGLDKEDDDSRLHKMYNCDLCNIKLNSYEVLQRHLEGKKHKIRADRQGKNYICEICDIVANSEIQLKIHLRSSRHKQSVLKKEHKEFTEIPNNAHGLFIILFCVCCIFINLLLLFKFVNV